jgi:hypothetical protein
MATDISFINELFRIVNGALRLDIDKVRNYTAFLADKLENAGEPDAELSEILTGRRKDTPKE